MSLASAVVRLVLLVLLAGSAGLPAHAQDKSPGLLQMHHTAWSTRDGSPGPVLALAQTPDGWLWLGTPTGLFRFDGVNFQRIDALGGVALRSSAVRSLAVDRRGALWIGYLYGGASRFLNGALTNYGAEQGLPNSATLARITVGPDGRVWAAAVHGLFRLAGDKWERVLADRSMVMEVFVDHVNIGRAASPPRTENPQPANAARPAGQALPEHADLAPRRSSQGSAPRQGSPLTRLPLELLQETGAYLSDKDLAALARSSRQMHASFVGELDKRHGVAHHEAVWGLQQLLQSFGSGDSPARAPQALRDDVSRWARRLRPEGRAPIAAAFVSQALHGIAPQQAGAALHASLEMAQSLPFGPQGQVLKTVLQSHQLNRLRDPQEAEAVFTEMRNTTLSHLGRPEFMGLFKALVHDQLPQLPTEVGQRMQQRFQALLPHLRPGEQREMQQILAQGEKLAATAAGIRDVRARIAALNPRR